MCVGGEGYVVHQPTLAKTFSGCVHDNSAVLIIAVLNPG